MNIKAQAGKARPKRKSARPALPIQRQLLLEHEGRYFNLREIFSKLNRGYFRGALRGYRIVWGRKRKQRPSTYFVFGTIQEADRVIRIHPLLDAPFVPAWFLEYVVYHEMLHAVVPDEYAASGRRRVHTEAFLKKEMQYPHYRKARAWEKDNLARFLR